MQKAAIDIKAKTVPYADGFESEAFSEKARGVLDLNTAYIKRTHRRRIRKHIKNAIRSIEINA